MPIYKYCCPRCKATWENMHIIAQRNNERCLKCNTIPTLVPCLAQTQANTVCSNYWDENLNTWITDPGHRKRVMKEKHAYEAG